MTALMIAERRKLTSVRAWWILAAAVAAYPLLSLIGVMTASAAERGSLGPDTLLSAARGGADVAVVAALMLGILAVAGEYRHGTIVPTLLAEPRRHRLVAAKLASQAMAGGAVALATVVIGVVGSGIYLATIGVDVLAAPYGDIAVAAVGVTLAGGFFGAIGAGLGAIVRNQTAAITGALVWLLAVEGALPLVLRNPELRDWLLTGSVGRLFHLAEAMPGRPSALVAAGVLSAVVAAFGLLALVVTTRSDID